MTGKQNHVRLKRTTLIVLIAVQFFLIISAGISIWRQYQHTWNVVELQAQSAAYQLDRWIHNPLRFFDALPLTPW